MEVARATTKNPVLGLGLDLELTTISELVLQDSSSHRIAGITRFLNENYSERLSIDDIARVAGMSTFGSAMSG